MSSQNQDILNEFFQIFTESITKTLNNNLDNDVCKKIQFQFKSSSKIQDAEDLKNNKAIYKIDYATGNRQGSVVALIPEELIADIADILTGGNGQNTYKGNLSELETNSVSKILTKVFKDVESSFKYFYNQDFVFSADPQLLLKEMPEYEVNSDGVSLDFLISNILTLNKDKEYKVEFLLSEYAVENLMKDLDFSKSSSVSRKNEPSSLDINCLSDVKIHITAELGRTRVPIKYALELVRGSVIELDTQNNADIKVFANDVEFAYAQIVAVDDNFGLKITKIISPEERLGCI